MISPAEVQNVIDVACPCGAAHSFARAFAGRIARCPQLKRLFRIPLQSGPTPFLDNDSTARPSTKTPSSGPDSEHASPSDRYSDALKVLQHAENLWQDNSGTGEPVWSDALVRLSRESIRAISQRGWSKRGRAEPTNEFLVRVLGRIATQGALEESGLAINALLGLLTLPDDKTTGLSNLRGACILELGKMNALSGTRGLPSSEKISERSGHVQGVMPSKSKKCFRCGTPLAKRIVPGTLASSAVIIGGGSESKAAWRAAETCIKCNNEVCMVRDCKARAVQVFRHDLNAGGEKTPISVPNDVWVCGSHIKPVRAYRAVSLTANVFFWIWAWTTLVVTAVSLDKGAWWSGWCMSSTIAFLATVFFVLRQRLALCKKAEFQDTLHGVDRDSFSAPAFFFDRF